MPRLMSFSETIEQVREQTKTVTRRDAWEWLDEGTYLKPVEKAMGLKEGESVTPIFDDGTLIRVVDVRREMVAAIHNAEMFCSTCIDREMRTFGEADPDPNCDNCDGSGTVNRECDWEGFPQMSGSEFVDYFCEAMGVEPDDKITRIKFEYVPFSDHDFSIEETQ